MIYQNLKTLFVGLFSFRYSNQRHDGTSGKVTSQIGRNVNPSNFVYLILHSGFHVSPHTAPTESRAKILHNWLS